MSHAPDRTSTEPRLATERSWWIGAAIVLLAALGMRFWGIHLGLPHLEARPDETEVLQLTLKAARGEFNFDWAIYPHAYAYLQWAWAALVLALQSLTGIAPSSDMLAIWRSEPERLYAIGRWLSALAGAATVGVVLFATRRELGTVGSLLAGLWLALSFLHVRESHALKPDSLMTLGLALCIPASVALARKPGARTAILAGLAVGAASAMKYNGVLGAAAVCVGAWMGATGERGWRRILPMPLLVAGLSAAAFFVATSPFLLFNQTAQGIVQANIAAVFPTWVPPPPAGFGIDVSTLEGPTIPEWVLPYGRFAAFVYHFGFSFWYGVGWLGTLLMPVAIVFGLFRKDALLRSCAVFAVVWYATVGLSPVTLSRYVTPMLPAVAILETALIVGFARRFAGKHQAVAAAALCAAIIAQPAWSSIRYDRLASRPDTRVLASDWLEACCKNKRVLVLGTRFWHYGEPRIPHGVLRVPIAGRNNVNTTNTDFVVAHDHELFWSTPPPGFLERNSRRLELVAEFDPRLSGGGQPIFEANDAYYIPIAGLGAVSLPGPQIRIYRVR